MDIIMKTNGNNIKKARKAAGLTQEQTAELIGISLLHYGRLERGERSISLKQLTLISDALNADIGVLLKNSVLPSMEGSRILDELDSSSLEHVEYALALIDEFRSQIMAYYQHLKTAERNRASSCKPHPLR